ncbi:MAG: glycoside hydrolase family 127 protein, partial [Victivallales bacterium]|nr:glycoside hydrolase family 127 protein [Victivallales bacterium]
GLRVEPDKKWMNLHADHELYCAGHLMEAAVAYNNATGKRKFLDLICGFANLICDEFGAEPGKRQGYPGHPEIELALVKLYSATGERKYLELSRFFLLNRGTTPNYFKAELKSLNKEIPYSGFKYLQAHKPLLDQEAAEGHAVRALYLYTGMAEVAAETGDQGLADACRRLWLNVTTKRMHVTGGVGPSPTGEMFTFDYDLPNETAYAETCAAIALVFFTRAMLTLEDDASYADIMERSLYNGVLSGVGLDGKHFFYANPLAASPQMNEFLPESRKTTRQEWFGCSCCPPNIARILASLGGYAYFEEQSGLTVNLYIAGSANFAVAGTKGILEVETNYPWDGDVRMTMGLPKSANFALKLRLPTWCDSPSLAVNGKIIDLGTHTTNGYAYLDREWKDGDTARLILPMKA